ncbi:MAG TPA: NUDIX hydrolase [Candidatus Altiarchaeales archaeon]|nr:NUDIX hydrolase [Candidatus Altiarchaeales archaeon]
MTQSEKKFPRVTVDAVIIKDKKIVLIRRKNEPFKDFWALPGGFVEYGETVEQAILREVKEETGLDVKIVEIIGVYSAPDRDPRGHTISIAFLCKPISASIISGSDASEAKEFSLDALPKLAFDHEKIIKDAIKKIGL